MAVILTTFIAIPILKMVLSIEKPKYLLRIKKNKPGSTSINSPIGNVKVSDEKPAVT